MKSSKKSTKEINGTLLFPAAKKHRTAIIKILKSGGVGILPTDTLYGLVGSALLPKTVARIYKLRRRNPKKPLIVLISSVHDLKLFGIQLNSNFYILLSSLWPGKVSIILPCPSKKFAYLHRGTKSIAFRLPKSKILLSLLRNTGPLAAPSANIEGKPPAHTVLEAQKYFGDKIDFYANAGAVRSEISTLIKIKGDKIIVLRKGAVKL